jgi:hypothetical protein
MYKYEIIFYSSIILFCNEHFNTKINIGMLALMLNKLIVKIHTRPAWWVMARSTYVYSIRKA